MAEIQGVVVFCDDVREELTGKSTYVGMLGGQCFADDQPGHIEIVAAFIGRVRGAKSVPLKITLELLNHSIEGPILVFEQEFRDKTESKHDEWVLKINARLTLPFQPGAHLRMLVEGERFRTDGTLSFEIMPLVARGDTVAGTSSVEGGAHSMPGS